MIRIIENGKYRTAVCSCGCKFSFDLVDVNTEKQVSCPECGEKVSVQIKETAQ